MYPHISSVSVAVHPSTGTKSNDQEQPVVSDGTAFRQVQQMVGPILDLDLSILLLVLGSFFSVFIIVSYVQGFAINHFLRV